MKKADYLIFFVFLFIVFTAVSQARAADDKPTDKNQPEGATALDPEEVTLYCDALSQEPVITCLFANLDYFSQRTFLQVVSHNSQLTKHSEILEKLHKNLYGLSFHELAEGQNGLYLLNHNQSEIEIKGVSLLPDFGAFEYTLPPEATIHIRVVSIDQDDDDDNKSVGSDEVSDSASFEMFVAISDQPDQSATHSGNVAVGFLQGAPVDDSIDPSGKEGSLLVAPDWESLIASLQDWQIDSLIRHLNANNSAIQSLLSLFGSDKEACKELLIVLLNSLMERFFEPSHDTTEAASASETASEITDEQATDCHCDNDLSENPANQQDR
ncbi:hypothetical protein [Endozoicomonas lisbonensis]|uniref:Uncharacterized protein n=1 Tax=Endozoicomonas lisbonensis TaxID=3120522 RepID=A0ABV2SIM5_9GAMM